MKARVRIYKVETLSRGEKLMLMRRRKRLTQADMAEHFKVSQMSISNYELGRRRIPALFAPSWFAIEPDDMTSGENLRMWRIRLGLGLREMAGKMRVSHVTYLKMEAGKHGEFKQ